MKSGQVDRFRNRGRSPGFLVQGSNRGSDNLAGVGDRPCARRRPSLRMGQNDWCFIRETEPSAR
jgi:hypothetical protein